MLGYIPKTDEKRTRKQRVNNYFPKSKIETSPCPVVGRDSSFICIILFCFRWHQQKIFQKLLTEMAGQNLSRNITIWTSLKSFTVSHSKASIKPHENHLRVIVKCKLKLCNSSYKCVGTYNLSTAYLILRNMAYVI